MKISVLPFGKVNNAPVSLYTLENDNGIKTSITNYGGIMTSLYVPDRSGKTEDIVLGFNSIDGYLGEHPYFGALIGRFGNRIGKGTFELDGVTYKLAINNGPNHLHGGLKGFDKVIWDVEQYEKPGEVGIKLQYFSKDMEEGYPGNLKTEVLYSLTNSNELRMEYFAETDKKTHVNLTQHNYYNLNGCKSDVREHILAIWASKYTITDADLIPTGELGNVAGSAYDFRNPKKIGTDIDKINMGYDDNFIIDNFDGSLRRIALVEERQSGRVMEVYSTQPGVQLYTANWLDGTLTGKNGEKYKKQFGFCLETQHFPDSPNKPAFPSTILEPGQKYHQLTVHKFSTK